MTTLPTSEIVARAWVQNVTGLADTSQIGRTLPEDETKWSTSGFIQLTTVGGSPSVDIPVAKPVVQMDFWAVSPSSGKPPWGKANNLAEMVRAAIYRPVGTITLPANFSPARLLSAVLMIEPRPIYGNKASIARYSADIRFEWVNA